MIATTMISTHAEVHIIEQLQRDLSGWLATKADLLRLADNRDQLLASLNERYGCATAPATAEVLSHLE